MKKENFYLSFESSDALCLSSDALRLVFFHGDVGRLCSCVFSSLQQSADRQVVDDFLDFLDIILESVKAFTQSVVLEVEQAEAAVDVSDESLQHQNTRVVAKCDGVGCEARQFADHLQNSHQIGLKVEMKALGLLVHVDAQDFSASVSSHEESSFEVDHQGDQADEALRCPIPVIVEAVVLIGWDDTFQLLIMFVAFLEASTSVKTCFAELRQACVNDLKSCCGLLRFCVD